MVFSGLMPPPVAPPEVHTFIASGRNTRRQFVVSSGNSGSRRSNEPKILQSLMTTYPTTVVEMKESGRISTTTMKPVNLFTTIKPIKYSKSEIIKSSTKEYPAKATTKMEADEISTLKSIATSAAATSMKNTGTEIPKSSMKTSATTGRGSTESERKSTTRMKSTTDTNAEASSVTNIPDENESIASSSLILSSVSTAEEISYSTLNTEEGETDEVELDADGSTDGDVIVKRFGLESTSEGDAINKIPKRTSSKSPRITDNESDSEMIDNSKNSNSKNSKSVTDLEADSTGDMPSTIGDWSDLYVLNNSEGSDMETDKESDSDIVDEPDTYSRPQIIVEEVTNSDQRTASTEESASSGSEVGTFSNGEISNEILDPINVDNSNRNSDLRNGIILVEDAADEMSQKGLDRFDSDATENSEVNEDSTDSNDNTENES
ncbi:hypothetical protein AVEN_15198-1 [Araneus ventricosus]|uniref:Uncharacterized protein n=1 Tax=Araneus ventricosus TaxID=182803 RepID=A0A4Y2MWI5_ARAVE|nr:hypothetical protein AVEN_15198-1 [Araneus ventricosus]